MVTAFRNVRLLGFALTASAWLLSGCAGVTPIRDLLNDPSHYDGKTVHIEGNVKGSVGGLGLERMKSGTRPGR